MRRWSCACEAGKTTLGRGVAEILGFDFDDLDEAWQVQRRRIRGSK